MGYIGAGPTSFNTADDLTVTGDAEFNGNLTVKGTTTTIDSVNIQYFDVGDNDRIRLGDSQDLQIYHDGSNSYIKDNGTGNLFIDAQDLRLRGSNGDKYAVFIQNGSSTLYYDDAEKIATTATGVDVTGTLTVDNFASLSATTLTIGGEGGANGVINSDESIYLNIDSNNNETGKVFRVGTDSTSTGGKSIALFSDNGDISFYDSTGTTSAFFWDASTQRLGLGTTSPSLTTEISGSFGGLAITNTTTTAGTTNLQQSYSGGSAELRIGSNTSGSNTAAMFVKSGDAGNVIFNGNVGIGTNSPTEQIHIENSSSAALRIKSTGSDSNLLIQSNDGALSSIFFGDVSDQSRGLIRYDNATENMFFSVNNMQEAMRIDSSGNVGIGTSSPAQKLHVVGQAIISRGTGTNESLSVGTSSTNTGTNFGTIDVNGTSYSGLYLRTGDTNRFKIFTAASYTQLGTITSFPLIFLTNDTERMRIDSSGNVGIGTTSPAQELSIEVGNGGQISGGTGLEGAVIQLKNNQEWESGYGSGGANPDYLGGIEFSSGDTSSGAGVRTAIKTTVDSYYNTNSLAFYTAPSNTTGVLERMRIDPSGDVGISKSAFGSISTDGFWWENGASKYLALSGTGTSPLYLNRNGSDGGIINFYKSGTLVGSISVTGSATAYNTSSDYRLKENVTADWDATTRLKQLNPVRFNFISDADTTVDGFLAHEVQDIVPEAISGTKDAVDDDGNPVYQGIDQSKLVPLLVKTIQELEARIAALENA